MAGEDQSGTAAATEDITFPPYVTTDADRARWRNSLTLARNLFPGETEAQWSATRSIFHDRESYPD